MKKSEVKIGEVYTAKVSKNVVNVRIDSAHSKQGWNATNTKTGKRIHIKSAQRLRGPAKGGAKQDAPKSEKPKDATPKAKAKMAASDKPKRLSALDAAAQVLAKAGEPMGAKDLIGAMDERGLWKSPAGKTPHATLYAAIIRDIGKKGDESRFEKVDRGLFVARG